MTDLTVLGKRYYIVDTHGNFYRSTPTRSLEKVNKADAQQYTYSQAMLQIGGEKDKNLYRVAAVESDLDMGKTVDNPVSARQSEYETGKAADTAEETVAAQKEKKSGKRQVTWRNVGTEQRLEPVDWSDFISKIEYVGAHLWQYRDQAAGEQLRAEQEIQQLLTFIEENALDENDSMRMMMRLKAARIRRRRLKEELYLMEQFEQIVGERDFALLQSGKE